MHEFQVGETVIYDFVGELFRGKVEAVTPNTVVIRDAGQMQHTLQKRYVFKNRIHG